MMEIRFAKRSDGDALRRIYDGEPGLFARFGRFPPKNWMGFYKNTVRRDV
ncbi:hypothetical protein [Fumia xinanensis]|uniref:Uncharacterized protein n=1 Tax=Fumia xinanensis TaxID=2763659 RepID=A0A926I788_9FIRM|nr:hypothetical protein [Fumia xinanensis]MBC8559592.1 hypothetical protein [Fumia xinanensis]